MRSVLYSVCAPDRKRRRNIDDDAVNKCVEISDGADDCKQWRIKDLKTAMVRGDAPKLRMSQTEKM